MSSAAEVLNCWFKQSTPKQWFVKDLTFDATIEKRFGSWVRKALNDELSDWAQEPETGLALILLLDQFTRHMVTGGKTPVLPAEELKKMGYTIVIHPAAGFLSCAAGLAQAYGDLKKNGTVTEATPMYSFADFNQMIGFPKVWAFDKKYAED